MTRIHHCTVVDSGAGPVLGWANESPFHEGEEIVVMSKRTYEGLARKNKSGGRPSKEPPRDARPQGVPAGQAGAK